MDIKVIWDTYEGDLKRFILSKVKDAVSTDDLLQEVYIKAQTKLDTLHNADKIKSWLFSVARNTVFDYFEERKKVILQDDLATKLTNYSEERPTDSHTAADCLLGIIKSLPKKYSEPLFLSDIKGMKQKAIALQLNLPLATVKSQIQRGRKMIAEGYMYCCDYKLNEKGYLVGEVKEKADCKICKD